MSARANDRSVSPSVYGAEPAGAAEPARAGRDLGLACLVGLAVAAFYLPSVRYGFVYDDGVLFAQAPTRPAGELWRVLGEAHWRHLPYWRPLARLSLEAGKLVHGRGPAGFHAVNAALAGLVAMAACLFLRRTLGVRGWIAAAVALLLCVHPVASSCTLPIAGRETLLASLFAIAAVGAWCARGAYGAPLAWVACALALLAREMAVAVPVLCAAADVLGISAWGRARRASSAPRSPVAWTVRHAPWLVLVGAWWLARARVLDGAGGAGGAGGVELALLERPLGPLLSLGHALASAFAPGTALDYEPPLAVWARPGRLALAALGAALLAWRAWSAARAGAVEGAYGVRRRVAFGLAWTLAALLPTANVLVQEARFAERHVFFPLCGLAIVLAATAEGDVARAVGRRAWPAALVAALGAAALASAARAPAFRDDERFLARWVASNPASAQAALSHGCALVNAGRAREGEAELRRALELLPDYADAHANLGALLAARGDDEAGVPHLRQAVRLAPDVPLYHANLASALLRRGNAEGAVRERRRVVALTPDAAQAWIELGEVLAVTGARDEARTAFERALALRPGWELARRRLADLGPP